MMKRRAHHGSLSPYAKGTVAFLALWIFSSVVMVNHPCLPKLVGGSTSAALRGTSRFSKTIPDYMRSEPFNATKLRDFDHLVVRQTSETNVPSIYAADVFHYRQVVCGHAITVVESLDNGRGEGCWAWRGGLHMRGFGSWEAV